MIRRKAAQRVGLLGAGAFGLALALAAPASAAPVPIVNGGFETPDISATTSHPNQGGSDYRFDVTNANSPDFTGWEIITGNIDILRTYWQPAEGAQSIDLYGCQPATIRQKVPSTAGVGYRLTFAKAGNPDPAGLTRAAEVRITDSVTSGAVATMISSFDTTGRTRPAMGWVDDSLTYTGTGNDVWISFSDVGGTGCGGLALDNVRVETTDGGPEPVIPEASLVALLPLSAVALVGATYLIMRKQSAVTA